MRAADARADTTPFHNMSGWGDLFADKYEEVLDESTGQMIMVDKNAPKYKLDEKGNVINPPPKEEAPAQRRLLRLWRRSQQWRRLCLARPRRKRQRLQRWRRGCSSGGGFVFGGAVAPASNGSSGGGLVFGGGGGAPAPASNGGGFVFGAGGGAAAAPGFGGGGEKRKPDGEGGERRTEAKRRRTRDLRLTGDESGKCLVVGNGDCGQLGLGEEDDDIRDTYKPLPIPILNKMNVKELVCGGLHTGALTLDGRLFTWGCNDDEALGRQGEESSPALVEGGLLGKRVTMVTAGDSHMAALTSEGQVYAWGTYKDSNGYIDPNAKPESSPRKIDTVPVLVPNLPSIKHLASGGDHVLAYASPLSLFPHTHSIAPSLFTHPSPLLFSLMHSVASNGYDVYGWGCGEKGQLGKELSWAKGTTLKYIKPSEPFDLRLPSATGISAGATVQSKADAGIK